MDLSQQPISNILIARSIETNSDCESAWIHPRPTKTAIDCNKQLQRFVFKQRDPPNNWFFGLFLEPSSGSLPGRSPYFTPIICGARTGAPHLIHTCSSKDHLIRKSWRPKSICPSKSSEAWSVTAHAGSLELDTPEPQRRHRQDGARRGRLGVGDQTSGSWTAYFDIRTRSKPFCPVFERSDVFVA